jgi:hypothetical protein
MLKWKKILSPLLGIIFAAISCGKSQEEDKSDLKWGIFRQTWHVNNTGLLSLPPNSKICVRGYMAKETVAAIKQWSDAVGRTTYLPANVDCVDGKRNIEIRGPRDSACQGGIAGDTNTVDRIRVCQQFPAPVLQHVLLHEVGHMWGLCDQYGGGQECQQGRVNPNTIMGAASGITRLTPDDIEGIKFVTSQSNLGANRAWQSIQKSPQQNAAGVPSNDKAVPAAGAGQIQPQLGKEATSGQGTNTPQTRRRFIFNVRFR